MTLEGGFINNAYVYDYSTMNVFDGGGVGRIYAFEGSRVNVSGGSVLGAIDSHRSTVTVSGDAGSVWATLWAITEVGGDVQGEVGSGLSFVTVGGSVGGDVTCFVSGSVSIGGDVGGNIYAYGTWSDSWGQWGPNILSINGSVEGKVDISEAIVTIAGDVGASALARGYSHLYIGGNVASSVIIQGTSTASLYGDVGGAIEAYNNSSLEIFSGAMNQLHAYDNSTVDIFGGSVALLGGWDDSTVSFYGGSWILDHGLELVENRLYGTGRLWGQWADGTSWLVNIFNNDGSIYLNTLSGMEGVIGVIPAPGAMLLAGIGMSMIGWLRRRRVV